MKAAPLALRAADLRLAVARMVLGWPEQRAVLLGARLLDQAADLDDALGCALSFPEDRRESLRRADRAVVALRGGLNLAAGLDPPADVASLLEQLAEVGRMIGGWQRSQAD